MCFVANKLFVLFLAEPLSQKRAGHFAIRDAIYEVGLQAGVSVPLVPDYDA